MASSTPMKDMEERFFQCSFCLENLENPKYLPCLHRYCEKCLTKMIETDKKTVLNCPLCNGECEVPKEGAAGFKSDFHTNNMLEYIELQKQFEQNAVRECAFCERKQTVKVYCFKCKDFLCDKCSQMHLTKRMFTDHQQHILNLKTVEGKNLTLQILASLTEDPRCHNHTKYPAQLCCATCGNMPVCVTCTYGKHKDHDLHDVTEIAKAEREKITESLGELDIYKDKLYQLQQMIEPVRKNLKASVIEKTEKLIAEHKYQFRKIERKVKENEALLEQSTAEIEKDVETECSRVEKEFDDKFARINAERANVLKETKEKHEERRRQNTEKHDEILAELNRKLGALDGDLKSFKEIISTQSTQNKEGIQEIADHTKHTINRYDNFTATTSTILASNDAWTDAQCLPDIRSASEPLIEDMRKEYPQLESLSGITLGDLPSVFDIEVTLTEREESVVDIKGMNGNGWDVSNMTSGGDGRIVITGEASDEYSFITVINMKGEVLRHDKIKKEEGSKWGPSRFCDSLSHYQMVTLCQTNQIGIYDVRDGTHTKKNISGITSSWSSDRFVSCITTDPLTKNIFVGSTTIPVHGSSRDVVVFDNKLNYRRTLQLPEMIKGSRDITVHRDNLLLCDAFGKKVFAVTKEGMKAELVYELSRLDLDGYDWWPYRVCTDSNDFIYVLWWVEVSAQPRQIRRVLTQYNQNGRQLLATIPVDGDAMALCTTTTDEGEKLLISTWKSCKIYTFGLVTEM